MSKWEIVRHMVVIAGRVTDAETAKAVAGARVSLGAGPETFTTADGHFHYLDLPPGDYTLQASLPGSGSRYSQVEATATVTRDRHGSTALAIANLELPSPLIQGRIPDQDSEPAPTIQTGGEQSPPAAPAEANQGVTSRARKRPESHSPQQPPLPRLRVPSGAPAREVVEYSFWKCNLARQRAS